jgi:hypothetical protein
VKLSPAEPESPNPGAKSAQGRNDPDIPPKTEPDSVATRLNGVSLAVPSLGALVTSEASTFPGMPMTESTIPRLEMPSSRVEPEKLTKGSGRVSKRNKRVSLRTVEAAGVSVVSVILTY